MSEADDLLDYDDEGFEKPDELHIGLKILSFLIPLAGAIIYFVKRNDQPKSSQQACNMAIYGFIFGIVIRLIGTVLGG